MKLPDLFFRYFCFSALLLIAGFILVITQTAIRYPHLEPLGPAALQARADYHSSTLVPYMAGIFPRLFLSNAGVALFILMAPLFWVWIWWFRRNLLDMAVVMMQGTVGLLMVALGHNSFSKIYITYRLLSWQTVAAMYLPHGLPEMLAFVLAGTTTFVTIGALKEYLRKNEMNKDLHPGEVCFFILDRVWKAGLLVFALMAGAAAIECWVTPGLVQSAFEAELLNFA